MKIGVISDTHGFLDPEVLRRFAGVDHILHAGDVGSDFVVAGLETVAPVTAVLGNTDTSRTLRLTESVSVAGLKFLIHHIVDPRALTDELRQRIARERPDAVVFGHTHLAFQGMKDGVLFLNPGYAGKPKHGTRRSAAILHSDGTELRVEFLNL